MEYIKTDKYSLYHFTRDILPTAIWIGWVPNRFGPILVCIGSFIVMYFIIWFVMTLYWKRKIETLNHQLK